MRFLDTMAARAVPLIPRTIIKRVSQRYIAGSTLEEAIRTVACLHTEGFMVTIDVLGETSASSAEAEAMADAYLNTLDAISRLSSRTEISIKPTALGLLSSEAECERRVRKIIERAGRLNVLVCLDMEDSRCTEMEIELLVRLRLDFAAVGIAVQAYLKRSYADLDILVTTESRLRICKGIYVEEATHLVDGADRDRSAINSHFLAHVSRCFDDETFVSIATHDESLIENVLALIARKRVASSSFEFQVLLGVCEPLRNRLRDMGFAVRVYVPYGSDWYGYSVRRIQESPRLGGYVLKALLTGKA